MINKNLKVKILNIRGSWKDVYRSCLNTINKEVVDKEPSSEWKRRIVLSEHSPIRKISIEAKLYNLYYWVSTHLVRHHIGIDHFVSTQRTDLVKDKNRDNSPQNAPVDHEFDGTVQSIINISRKRCCFKASPETREAWNLFLEELRKEEPEIVSCCVKECVYRNGLCPEHKSCGYNKNNPKFEEELRNYTEVIKNQINEKTSIFTKEEE